jgi:HprK-related kinase A
MKHAFTVRIGPTGFRIGSDWRAPIAGLEALYRDYPKPEDRIPQFTVRLEAVSTLRRFIRPSVQIAGDHTLPDALPLPLAQGVLAAEMAMNLQMALGQRHFLLLHAASVERDDKVIILTGESGSGKSTLAALLGENGWRLLGDEFALIDPATGLAHPFPRPISLKKESIAEMEAIAPADRFGQRINGTPKGDIRHLVPNAAALEGMDTPARPALILFPRFGAAEAVRPVAPSEVFIRLTQASTNYVALAERGYTALTRLVTHTPARAIDYPDTESALALVEQLWGEIA